MYLFPFSAGPALMTWLERGMSNESFFPGNLVKYSLIPGSIICLFDINLSGVAGTIESCISQCVFMQKGESNSWAMNEQRDHNTSSYLKWFHPESDWNWPLTQSRFPPLNIWLFVKFRHTLALWGKAPTQTHTPKTVTTVKINQPWVQNKVWWVINLITDLLHGFVD